MNDHISFCRLSLTKTESCKRRLNLKMVIPIILALVSGTILYADSIDGITIPDIGKIGFTGVLGYAVFALWKELKASRKEFTDYLKDAEREGNNIRREQLETNKEMKDAISGLSDSTNRTHKIISEIAQALNKQKA